MRFALIVSTVIAVVVSPGAAPRARADDSKLGREDVMIQPRALERGKNKLCCGYPLSATEGFALHFYHLALERDYDEPAEIGFKNPDEIDLYTPEGYYLGSYPEKFAWSLRMEGTGLLTDGRVLNYTGRCNYGYGTCFEEADTTINPYGRGAQHRPLIPFKSAAVDPRVVPIGEPLYVPEFDGMVLPDGSIHDGCVRGDDTGGNIKGREMDFFVVTYANFRFLLEEMANISYITPQVESPRCEYMRDYVRPSKW